MPIQMPANPRDALILRQAFATAIVAFSLLPEEEVPWSNVTDMKQIFSEMGDGSLALLEAELTLTRAMHDPTRVKALYAKYGIPHVEFRPGTGQGTPT
jgi:hypothetical protein